MQERILYVITRAERGGAQTHVLELLHASVGRYDVALATGESGFLTQEAKALGIPVFLLTNLAVPLNPLQDIFALVELSGVIRKFRPSMIHAHSSKAGLLARVDARLHGIPCVFTAHGWAFSDGASRRRRWVALPSEWLAGHLGATTIVVSKSDYALALRFGVGKVGRISTIVNGIADNASRARPEEGNPPIVTMVARFSFQKDHLTLLRALSKVRLPFRLRLVGDGPLLEQTRVSAAQLGLASRTDFLGDCGNVADLLVDTHLFTLISRYEGLPISILEAMRAGLPIIATNTGGVPEAVCHEWNGLLVGRGDEQALKGALELLLSKPDLRAAFGKRARSLFEEAFSAEAMVERTFELYDRTLTRGFQENIAYQHDN